MQPKQITDDLERLLEILPPAVQNALSTTDRRVELLEVVLDLGRLPEARYPNEVVTLGEKYLSRNDLQAIIQKLGPFGSDNRTGIESTLHRISAIRNRQQDIVGITCRVGRAVFGTVAMVRDLIESKHSLLLMGRPGVGKTTALREIARVMADDLHRRVVIIDTSNEIAGDGDIPHPAIGKARRMQVARPEQQHEVMIEAVENHMPEVIVIDEIGRELETQAARTIAERGVQLIATAHGNTIANLVKNPTLSDLVGGIQSVTLGDDEARRRHTQKTVLERAYEPTFQLAVEINSRVCWSVHMDVASSVDLLLRGQFPKPQERELGIDGAIHLINSSQNESAFHKPRTAPNLQIPNAITPSESHQKSKNSNNLSTQKILFTTEKTELLQILCCGISHQKIDETIRLHDWPARWVEDLEKADVILSIRHALSKNQELRRKARHSQIPIHVIKSNTMHQIERAIERLLTRRQHVSSSQQSAEALQETDSDDTFAALEECRLALENVVLPQGKPVELVPRNETIIKMQVDLIKRYRLYSDIFRNNDKQYLRIYPP